MATATAHRVLRLNAGLLEVPDWWVLAPGRSRRTVRDGEGKCQGGPALTGGAEIGQDAPAFLPFSAVSERTWRCSSAGQSRGIIILVSGVRIPAPPPSSGGRPRRAAATRLRTTVTTTRKPRRSPTSRRARTRSTSPRAPRSSARARCRGAAGCWSRARAGRIRSRCSTCWPSWRARAGSRCCVAHLDHGLRGARGARPMRGSSRARRAKLGFESRDRAHRGTSVAARARPLRRGRPEAHAPRVPRPGGARARVRLRSRSGTPPTTRPRPSSCA